MDSFFGTGFRDVRVHVGNGPARIGAAAFACGSALYFAPGWYRPRTRWGQELIGHELAHVVQQRSGRVAPLPGAGAALVLDRELEAEADRLGRLAARHRPGAPSVRPPRRHAPVAGRDACATVQPYMVIESGAGSGVYESTNLRALLNAVAVVLNTEHTGKGVKNSPLWMVHSPDFYRFPDLAALAQYMIAHEYEAVPPMANHPAPKLSYGALHGDLHFGGDPTAQKSKWTIGKVAAITLMETLIGTYMRRLRVESRKDGWDAWYLGGQHGAAVGNYAKGGTRGGVPTDLFSVQAQVNWLENEISYHGYPDEKLKRPGAGKSKTSMSDNK
jgi:hypothetical protein